MSYNTYSILVCDDCALMIANGEIDGDEDREREVSDALASNWGPSGVTLDDGRHDFMTGPCDGCGTALAGSRNDATGWSVND